MTTAALGAPRRCPRARAHAATAGKTLRKLAVRAISPHKAALANLRDVPLTVAGLASIDFAAFHLAHGWGWLVTGVSLIALEHVIADET